MPLVHGVAKLAGMAYGGASFGALLDFIGPEPAGPAERAAWLLDRSWAYWLNFSPSQAQALQREALAVQRVFCVRSAAVTRLRLLALAAPGNLMVNAPVDFLTEPAGVELCVAFLTPDGTVPSVLPFHDVAMNTASESAPEALIGLARVFGLWPRPILNDPQRVLPMSRTWLPHKLASIPGILSAAARTVRRDEVEAVYLTSLLPGSSFPFLLRPLHSHAGNGLKRVDTPQDVQAYLRSTEADTFTLTQFIDYRGPTGTYCKYRVAFVAGRPFICHMAVSEEWMVHYLNAGMENCSAKRAAEAAAMDGTDGFLQRHAAALYALAEAIGLDYFSIDCAQAKDGRLLVFEADTAAIVHSLDRPDLYPYKRPAMQRCYDAFGAMLRSKAAEHTAG